MRVTLPNPLATGAIGFYLAKLNQAIVQAFLGVPSETQAVGAIILRAPNGQNYKVTVDNAGTLTTTAV